MLKRPLIRDLAIGILILGAFWAATNHQPQKRLSPQPVDLQSIVPRELEQWKTIGPDRFEFEGAEWQAIDNILLREYGKEGFGGLGRSVKKIGFVLEYSNDFRNNFSLHFPENCHRASGNSVDFLPPLEIPLGNGKSVKAKTIFIKGIPGTMESIDKIVAYWLVIDGKPFHETFWIKLDQMLAGVLSGSKRGYLIRFDFYEGLNYTPEGIEEARDSIGKFVQDLYYGISPENRLKIFGA